LQKFDLFLAEEGSDQADWCERLSVDKEPSVVPRYGVVEASEKVGKKSLI